MSARILKFQGRDGSCAETPPELVRIDGSAPDSGMTVQHSPESPAGFQGLRVLIAQGTAPDHVEQLCREAAQCYREWVHWLNGASQSDPGGLRH